MDDHLVKPVSLVQLSTAIRRAVDRDASRMSQRHAQVGEVNGPGPVLDRLADELGDRSVVVEVVEVYLGELDRRVDGIVGAVRIGDGEAVRRLVHTLTAGSELLGVGALPTSCSAFARGELDEAGLRATAAAARDALVRWASSSTG
jgi:hypothetical protein